MSKLYQIRPIEKRGDPEGPPLEQQEHQERLRLLKQGQKNFDPRFGAGPIFRPLKHDKRVIWQRYPRAWICGVAGLMTFSVYGPLLWTWYSNRIRPLTEIEKKESQVVNAAIKERYGGTWKAPFAPSMRTE